MQNLWSYFSKLWGHKRTHWICEWWKKHCHKMRLAILISTKKGQLSSLWFEDQKNLRKYFESGHGTNEKAKCPKLRCRLQNSNFGLFSAINGFCSNDLTRANWPDKICGEISDSFELREVQEKKICQNPATKLDWSVKSENMWWNLWRWPSIQTLFYFNLIDKHEKYRNVVF